MKLEFAKEALEDLTGIDRLIAQRIFKKINFYAVQPNPLTFAKRLRNSKFGTYRFRIGEYRAVFDIAKGKIQILIILRIKHRKDIYDL